jgi:hypothetical protein
MMNQIKVSVPCNYFLFREKEANGKRKTDYATILQIFTDSQLTHIY